MAKIDLHTHSIASPDGSLTEKDYERILQEGRLDYIAVTDHDTIAFAKKLNSKLGAQIVIGEEITTREGEIIGLFLTEKVKSGMSAADTAAAIRDQGGLVYIPHPFEGVRKGLKLAALNNIAELVDIVEIHNGRAMFQNKSEMAQAWVAANKRVGSTASDAHGWHGWGRTYTTVSQMPTRASLLELLARATHQPRPVGLRGILYPKLNRLRKGKK